MVASPLRYACGITYLWMMFVLVMLGLGIGKGLDVYSQTSRREKEAEMLYVGDLYRDAIRQYWESSPDGIPRYPEGLEALLRDSRHVVTRRYLRRLWADPMTGGQWEPIPSPQGGIMGVRSKSGATPIKKSNFLPRQQEFDGVTCYCDWKFIATPAPASPATAPSPLSQASPAAGCPPASPRAGA